ncbi:hypothetical protein [Streptomyces lunaelactis]|uniref:hypothetical protein n=1 Tax=Streptomyces lunaelactis TaxID=1535768 RepID=UPI0020C7EE1F|nr:hypothetical protein [Streptomyces lunaelactis]
MIQGSTMQLIDLGPGECGVKEAGNRDVPVCEMGSQGRQPDGDQMLRLLLQSLPPGIQVLLVLDGGIPLGPQTRHQAAGTEEKPGSDKSSGSHARGQDFGKRLRYLRHQRGPQ